MAYASIAEAEARIAEIEKENKDLTRDTMTHKKGYQTLAKFLEGKGFDLKGDLDVQWEETIGKTKVDNEALTQRLTKMEKQLEKHQAEKEQLLRDNEANTIRADLSGKMKDIIGAEDLIDLWLAKGKVKLSDGKVVLVDKDKETPIETHLEGYKKSFPDRVKVSQRDGSNSSGSQQQQDNQNKSMKKEEFKKLAPTAQREYLDKGGELVP